MLALLQSRTAQRVDTAPGSVIQLRQVGVRPCCQARVRWVRWIVWVGQGQTAACYFLPAPSCRRGSGHTFCGGLVHAGSPYGC